MYNLELYKELFSNYIIKKMNAEAAYDKWQAFMKDKGMKKPYDWKVLSEEDDDLHKDIFHEYFIAHDRFRVATKKIDDERIKVNKEHDFNIKTVEDFIEYFDEEVSLVE